MLFVYVDYRNDTNEAFYVGQGNEARIKIKYRNSYHKRISKKHGFRREIVFQSENRDEVIREEIRLIAELKTFNDDNPNGANFTKGGDGSRGHNRIPTEETREKIRRSLSGRKQSEEVNKRRSEKLRGRYVRPPPTEEERKARSEKFKGVDLIPPESRKRQIAKLTGRKRSEAERRAISEGRKKANEARRLAKSENNSSSSKDSIDSSS